MNIENKKVVTVPFEVKQIEDEDTSHFFFEGYASTFGNVDLGGDVIEKGAFTDTIQGWAARHKNMPVLWQHDMDEPIGTFIEMREDSRGLFVKGRLPKEDTLVSGRIIPQIKTGSVADMSIGYIPVEFSFERDSEDRLIRKLQRIELIETSLVTMPMNPEANLTDFKKVVAFQDLPLADEDREWSSDDAIDRVRRFTGSEDEPSADYKNAFLWYDTDNAENFGAYKLPIADVIDGRLRAVPRAVFAAAAAVQGARGGVDIPDSDMDGVRRHITRYYRKMDREPPFDERSCFRVDFIEQLSERELERLFHKGVCFSKSQAKKLVKFLKSGRREVEPDLSRDAQHLTDILTSLKNL